MYGAYSHHLRGTMAGFNQGVHDQNYGRRNGRIDGNNNNMVASHHGTTGGGITGHGNQNNEKTSIFGRHTNGTHLHPNNVDTTNAGVIDAGNRNNIDTRNAGVVDSGNHYSVNEPTTPTRAGRFHQSSRSFERRPVGGGQAARGVNHMV